MCNKHTISQMTDKIKKVTLWEKNMFRKNKCYDENQRYERCKITINPLSANPTKWPTNCSSLFKHFVELALKGLTL